MTSVWAEAADETPSFVLVASSELGGIGASPCSSFMMFDVVQSGLFLVHCGFDDKK